MNARNELLQLLGEINDGLMALSKMEEFITIILSIMIGTSCGFFWGNSMLSEMQQE